MEKKGWIGAINGGGMDNHFQSFYGAKEIDNAKIRYTNAINEFYNLFDDGDIRIISAPGRTEIAGNHTDHNNGSVVAASVNLDMIAVVKKTDDNKIVLKSEGFGKGDVIDLAELRPVEEEKEHSASLIRGICSRIKELGGTIGGFVAYTTNNVLRGSGLSSSAAFEVCVAQIVNSLYNEGRFDAIELAKIGQYAENTYFGKPSGLLDQTACAVGGVVFIDFKDKQSPHVEALQLNLDKEEFVMCITDTGGSHAELTSHYASIPLEMRAVAQEMGATVLRDVAEAELVKAIPQLREKLGDRSILRALHFFEETKRAKKIGEILKAGDFNEFLKMVSVCGHSSFEQVQNAYVSTAPTEQNIPLALALSQRILGEDGACRLQGGGFAGTIQAFVPKEKVDDYAGLMESVFGSGRCYRLFIRSVGVCEIECI